MHRYSLGRKLGEGAFGDVRIAKHRATGEKVAIKTFKEKCNRIDQLVLQPEALRALSHPNIVQCQEYLFEEGRSRAHLVFELMDLGSLERHCRHQETPFSEAEVRSIFYQVLLAAEYMHSLNYIHRDIKPENILLKSGVDTYPTVKLADLGLAKHIGNRNERPKTTYVATRWYRSPEILLRLRNYGKPSDIWAIGVVMAEVVAIGTPLFPGSNEDDQLSRVISLRGHPACVGWKNGTRALNGRGPVPFVMPNSLRQYLPGASEPVLQLIEHMLEMDPLARPTAAEALLSSMFHPSPSPCNSFASFVNVGEDYDAPHSVSQQQPDFGSREYMEEVPVEDDESTAPAKLNEPPIQAKEHKLGKEKFYIPPVSEQNSLICTKAQSLRSPAGAFNVPSER